MQPFMQHTTFQLTYPFTYCAHTHTHILHILHSHSHYTPHTTRHLTLHCHVFQTVSYRMRFLWVAPSWSVRPCPPGWLL
jgi:hypothetical protein